MQDKKWLNDVELLGTSVTLIPLARSHADALVDAATDGELWKLWYTSVPNADSVHAYIDFAFSEKEFGRALPFVVICNDTRKVIGTTRYCNADGKNQRVEIGHTWYAKRYQRTAVNTECKLLLLAHAFEQLDAIAVEFRTSWYNHASRTAIARLGAKQDGVLRNHQKLADGSYRDTVVFSIINQEWPAAKNNLLFKLER